MPLYITEYANAAKDGHGDAIAAGMEPATTSQSVSISASSNQSAGLQETTNFVLLHTDEDIHLLFGKNPTATTSLNKMSAGETRFYGVGKSLKIAAIEG